MDSIQKESLISKKNTVRGMPSKQLIDQLKQGGQYSVGIQSLTTIPTISKISRNDYGIGTHSPIDHQISREYLKTSVQGMRPKRALPTFGSVDTGNV